jgi:dihydrofolate reductase
MRKIIVAAMDQDNLIGSGGEIPWHYPEDLKHFREVTEGYPVVMGRKTYFSLPEGFRPLPDRDNIVLSRSDIDLPERVEKAESLEDAWELAGKYSDTVYIIGGAGVYAQTLDEADEMVLTFIHDSFEGDTYFPDWNEENWEEIDREDTEELSFVTYRRV